jgi:TolA-binding protein
MVRRASVVGVVVAVLIVGCQSVRETFTGNAPPNPETSVEVMLYDKLNDQEVPVIVQADGHETVRLAVKKMQNKDFGDATQLLEPHVRTAKVSDRAHFALGVCYEKQDKLNEALAEYKAANIAKSTALYQQSQDRVKEKLGGGSGR